MAWPVYKKAKNVVMIFFLSEKSCSGSIPEKAASIPPEAFRREKEAENIMLPAVNMSGNNFRRSRLDDRNKLFCLA